MTPSNKISNFHALLSLQNKVYLLQKASWLQSHEFKFLQGVSASKDSNHVECDILVARWGPAEQGSPGAHSLENGSHEHSRFQRSPLGGF